MLPLALALSLAGLSVGPALVALGRARGRWRVVVEGFSLAVVPGLILLRLLPHVVEELGLWAVALVGAGYFTLRLADRAHHHDPAHDHAHHPTRGNAVGLAIVFPALLAHAFTDGAALAMASAAGGRAHLGAELAGALVLHRLPEGMFLANALVPRLGWRGAGLRLGAMALATVVGALTGESLLERIPDAVFDGVMSFGLGAMLRLAVHSHEPEPSTARARTASGAAFLTGVAAVLMIPDPRSVLLLAHPQELSFLRTLSALFVETAPAVLVGVVVAAWVRARVRPATLAWLSVPGALRQSARGAVFGAAMPLCSCGAVPVARELLSNGAPFAAVVAFLVATPELDLGAVVLAQSLLGTDVTLLRLASGVLVALGVGALLGRAEPSPAPRAPEEDRGWWRAQRLPTSLSYAVDQVAAWYMLGLVAAAVLEAAVRPGALGSLAHPWDLALAALCAIPLYVGPHAATPVAAVLIHKGAGVGAAMAFLLVSTGANAAVIATVGRARGRATGARFAAFMVLAAVASGMIAELAVGRDGIPEVHSLAAHHHGWIETGSGVLVAALLIASVARNGPRRWFRALQPDPVTHDHGHRLSHDHADVTAP